MGGRGAFTFPITENKEFKLGWEVQLFFEIQLHSKDEDLLKQIQASFNGVGSIYKYSNKNLLNLELDK